MRRFFLIYFTFFKQQIKLLIEYRMDFMLGMGALALQQVSLFIIIFAVFTRVSAIGGYSFNEILLFYGFSQMVKGIDHVYNDNIWLVGWGKIQNGSFSQYLIRPINIITHVVMERIQFDGFGELIIGAVIFVYAKITLGLDFTFVQWLVFILFLISGLAIFFAIKMMCASIAFWTIVSGEIMTVAYEINNFTRYPLDIYKSVLLKSVLLYLLPFAVVSYLPMVYFLRSSSHISQVIGINYSSPYFLIIFIPAIACVMLSAAFFIWNMGLKRYSATGT